MNATDVELDEQTTNLNQQPTTDWAALRREFPATNRYAYLRSAATGPLAPTVESALANYYEQIREAGDVQWGEWFKQREAARRQIAKLINAEPDEIAFTNNTSAGMNLIVDALEGRGEVISCELEFPVSTQPWMHRSIAVHRLTPDAGEIHPAQIAEAITNQTGVICLSHVQYSNGFRLDVEAVGEIKRDCALVVNAAQSAGVLPIDVRRMRIDALCTTGHKWLLAGYGTGFVYLSRELLERSRPRAISWMSAPNPFAMRNDEALWRDDAAARAELGVPSYGSILALGAAVEYLNRIGVEKIEQRALELNRYLTAKLIEADWTVLSPLRNERARSAETLVRVPDPQGTTERLAARGVLVTAKPEGIRVATHFFNNEVDIDNLIVALEECR